MLAATRGLSGGLIAPQQGGQAAAPAQQEYQKQGDKLYRTAAPGPSAPGAGEGLALPALRVAAGVAHRTGAQALSSFFYLLGGTGDVLFPASWSVVFPGCFVLSQGAFRYRNSASIDVKMPHMQMAMELMAP